MQKRIDIAYSTNNGDYGIRSRPRTEDRDGLVSRDGTASRVVTYRNQSTVHPLTVLSTFGTTNSCQGSVTQSGWDSPQNTVGDRNNNDNDDGGTGW